MIAPLVGRPMAGRRGLIITVSATWCLLLALCVVLCVIGTAQAEPGRVYDIDLPARSVADALNGLSEQTGVPVVFPYDLAKDRKANPVKGRYALQDALDALLKGTGLSGGLSDKGVVTISRSKSHSPHNGETLVTQNEDSRNGTRTFAAKRGGIAAILASIAAAFSASAQEAVSESGGSSPSRAESPSTADLSEIIVTGRAGIEQRTKEETSYSVTTIDQTKLRLQGASSVTESLKSVPGFWVEASGGEASGNVRARGIPVDGFGAITLLEDGMPVQHDPALGYLNGDQAFRLDETIDRIEVVRGGPSSIFYSNAPAGAVNYIPRSVGDHAEGTFKYTVGDYGLNRVDAWYGAPIGDWKLSLGGFYRFDNGVRDPGFHGDDGGQFRVSLGREFEGGKVSFDLKRLDDTVYLDLGIPMRVVADGKLRSVPGFDGNYGTIAGPETAYARMKTASGNDFLFDNTLGTQIKRTQATLNFEFEFADHTRFTDHVRYDDTGTVRNGVFPNLLESAANFLKQQPGSSLTSYPGATALQLRYTDSPSTVYDVANQNGNGLVTVGGLRSVIAPVKEFMNDARLMREFELGGQTHDATLGFYVANVSQDFSRYSSTAVLDVQNNARLLDLVAVDAGGKVVGTLTDHGIYHYGYEWANATGQSTTTAFYLADEWQVTGRLRIDAGTRWEQVHLTSNTEIRQTVNLGTPATSQVLTGTGQFAHFDQTFSKVGWTLGGNFQFTDRSGLFARVTPTFRLPNLSTYTTASLTTTNSSVSKPITQTMDLGEIGYKFANQWTNLYATAFWTKYNNVGFTNNVFNLNSSSPPIPQQLYADTKTYGLELEGGFYPVHWFDLTFNATLEQPQYNGLRYTDNVNGAPVLRDFDGNQLIRVPKVSVRVVPGVNLFGQRLRLQVSWEFEGARYVDTANSVVLPRYDVLNASARFSFNEHFDLYGYVDNITNSLGLTEGNPRAGEVQSADAGANTFIARPILGRAFRASLMYRF